MSIEWGSRKTLLMGGAIFLFTVLWAFFLDQLAITPDSLLANVGNIQTIGFIFSVPFAGFVLFFALTLGTITASSDKDERGRVYVAVLVPTIIACAISALFFSKFAQWYPLALFYFGSIPLMLETSRMKRLELKNFVILRSSFSGAQRGLQILGIGVLVTLAVVALPQNQTLYEKFEEALFQGKVIQQLDVQKITADFLITTQRNTLIQVTESDSFGLLRQKTDSEVTNFVTLMDQTLETVNSQEYRNKINTQVKDQQNQIDTQSILNQIQKTVPGYGALREYYWAIAAFMGSILFFLAATFIIQPLAAVFGTVLYFIIPSETYGMEQNPSPETASPTTGGWKTTAPESSAPTPTYTHVEEFPKE
jgi:hypothetical protein